MVISPQTMCSLYVAIPLTLGLPHTILFNSLEEQAAYFESNKFMSFADMTYIRQTGVIRVPIAADKIYHCNYLSFLNGGFGTKTFYAFITGVDYVNNDTSYIHFQIDNFQTWLFEMEVKKCFVEREHVSDDGKGVNTVPEGLETGDYIVGYEFPYNVGLGIGAWITNKETVEGSVINNVYTAQKCVCYRPSDTAQLNALLQGYQENPDDVTLQMVPLNTFAYSGAEPYANTTDNLIQVPHDVDGYTPKNNKLYCYPYCFAEIDNFMGHSVQLKYELSSYKEEESSIMPTEYTNGYYTGNYFLSNSEMAKNAQWIVDYLMGQAPHKWSYNAVCGMLGNVQTESGINPGIWQNLNPNRPSTLGFGLCQWTPSTKYTTWCNSNSLNPSSMEAAMQRLEYEIVNPTTQWTTTATYKLPITDYISSTLSAGELAKYWLHCYERPKDANQDAKRASQAEYWYRNLTPYGGEPANPAPPSTSQPDTLPQAPVTYNVGYNPILLRYVAIATPVPCMICFPLQYKGSSNCYEDGIIYDNFPRVPWSSSQYAQWLAMNGGKSGLAMNYATTGVGMAANAAGAVGSVLQGNVLGGIAGGVNAVFSGFNDIFQTMRLQDYHRTQGGALNGATISSGCLNAAMATNGFRARGYTIKKEYAVMIDEYFSRYGYKVCRMKVPELRSREVFNYVKTVEADIGGAMPNEARAEIENLFNAGITLWHTTEIGEYSEEILRRNSIANKEGD